MQMMCFVVLFLVHMMFASGHVGTFIWHRKYGCRSLNLFVTNMMYSISYSIKWLFHFLYLRRQSVDDTDFECFTLEKTEK